MLISPVFAHIPIGETAGFGFALVLPVIGIYLALYFLFIRPYQEPMKERRFVYILKTKIQKYISFNR